MVKLRQLVKDFRIARTAQDPAIDVFMMDERGTVYVPLGGILDLGGARVVNIRRHERECEG